MAKVLSATIRLLVVQAARETVSEVNANGKVVPSMMVSLRVVHPVGMLLVVTEDSNSSRHHDSPL